MNAPDSCSTGCARRPGWAMEDVRALCRGLGYKEVPNPFRIEAFRLAHKGLTIDHRGTIRCGTWLGGGFTPSLPPDLAAAWLLDAPPFT